MAKKDKSEQIQAHGQTAEFYEELQRKQHNGEVEYEPGNNVKNVTDRYLKDDLEANPDLGMVAEHERGFYHLLMEDRSFTHTGQRLSKSFVQKYSVQQFQDTEKSHHGWLGKLVEIIHDPTKEAGAKMTASKGGKALAATNQTAAPVVQKEVVKAPAKGKGGESATDLNTKTISQLKAIAKEKGVDIGKAKTKTAIIDAIAGV